MDVRAEQRASVEAWEWPQSRAGGTRYHKRRAKILRRRMVAVQPDTAKGDSMGVGSRGIGSHGMAERGESAVDSFALRLYATCYLFAAGGIIGAWIAIVSIIGQRH